MGNVGSWQLMWVVVAMVTVVMGNGGQFEEEGRSLCLC